MKVTLTVEFDKERQMKTFLNMLAWMELCGNTGHCTDFVVVMDGDGGAHPKFTFEDEELNAVFEEMRKKLEKNEFRTYPNKKCYEKHHDIGFCID